MPFISNLKRTTCASKRNVLELAILQYKGSKNHAIQKTLQPITFATQVFCGIRTTETVLMEDPLYL